MLTETEREEAQRSYSMIAERTANATQPMRRQLSFLEKAFRDAAANPGCATNDDLVRAMQGFMLEVLKLQTIERNLADMHFRLFHL